MRAHTSGTNHQVEISKWIIHWTTIPTGCRRKKYYHIYYTALEHLPPITNITMEHVIMESGQLNGGCWCNILTLWCHILQLKYLFWHYNATSFSYNLISFHYSNWSEYMNKRTYTKQQYQSGVAQNNIVKYILHRLRRSATYQTINWKTV